MNNAGTKIFFGTFVVIIVIAIYLSYNRTVIKKDFETFDSESEVTENEEPVEETLDVTNETDTLGL